ncbi:MAG: DEAD/DEAH box helicase family protein, partial [Candidatus Nanoarchaeia archaeon]|nr:DEAD/DEAH box helicase family protein [Candidatus Nanoarchaeia archaeon]
MVNAKSLGTGNIPLKLADLLSKIVNKEWEDGTFINKISLVTQDLLKFWDPKGSFSDLRNFNFHEGQWQAILNSIYVHEILKIKNVHDLYMAISPELLAEMDLIDLKKDKHSHPKYCIKMATGTGKTWIMHALLIWQYLNSKYNEKNSELFSKNFLLIAPGIIVYERLLDAFLGKRKEDGKRDFDSSDYKTFEDLFIPQSYSEELFGFLQSSVCQKEDINKKVTGDGLVAITNWHLLTESYNGNDSLNPIDNPIEIVKELLPVTPGTTAGHALNQLDNQYLKGKELDYLAGLSDLVVFNDEAHHLGEFKKADEVFEKKWQEALNKIVGKKQNKFIQIDFSATPYSVTGSGQKRTRHFFPHVIINFELVTAIKLGLVKTVAIDKRKELAALPLEYKADREGKDTTLSEGQRVMLRAGVTKLKILEEGFTNFDKNKIPKMLIVCEDTTIVPLVSQFLIHEGFSEDDILEIHSNKKGEIGQEEWDNIKQKLFSIDKNSKPKIIISVLMLREGFDVNSICVIVPLRSSSSYILLEQTIGRGLRLMWREPEYEEIKFENRTKLLLKKEEPNNYLDILSIIEHPNFIEFYERELSGALAETKTLPNKDKLVGDLILIKLKENYKDYDLFWPLVIYEKEEYLNTPELSLNSLEQFPIPLDSLTPLVPKNDVFYGEEITVKTRFEYAVTADIFTAKSYNSFIAKVVNAVSSVPIKLGKKTKNFPTIQINTSMIAKLTDEYIRIKLFGKEFDPIINNNWKILLLTQEKIIQHIVKNISQAIYDMQNNFSVVDAKIIKKYFSEMNEMRIRDNYSIKVAKSIYERIGFPSNKGGFEKAFIEFVDSDSKVNSFMKINE